MFGVVHNNIQHLFVSTSNLFIYLFLFAVVVFPNLCFVQSVTLHSGGNVIIKTTSSL